MASNDDIGPDGELGPGALRTLQRQLHAELGRPTTREELIGIAGDWLTADMIELLPSALERSDAD